MKLIKVLKMLRLKIYIWMFCHSPIKNNKIILWADSFKHFGCNPKYIALYLLKNYPRKFDFVWVFANGVEIPQDFPEGIRVVRYFSVNYLKELHTAKFIICNMRTGFSHMWNKRNGQIYIQTWHSFLRLKRVEKDASETLPEDYIKIAKLDSLKIDLLISGCAFSTEIFKRAFWYEGEILECGTPRNDILINCSKTIRNKVFDCYGIKKNKKLLLYAPTFRKEKKADLFGMDFDLIRNALKNNCSDDWVMAYRLHPNIYQQVEYSDCVSMTDYSDMQELICAADILITDYSSCMFDMAIAKKPCFLYVPDLDSYIEEERKLYFDIFDLPFPVTKSMGELCNIVLNFDFGRYYKRLNDFIDKIGSYENGIASQCVSKYILGKMNEC